MPSFPPASEPFETIAGSMTGGLLLLCDHARNTVPEPFGDLGLPADQFERHIAYDIGGRPLTLELARRLQAPALMTTFSRLLIDPNRGEDDPTIVMRLSDGAVVPGNARIDADGRQARIELFHRPYHAQITRTLDAMLAVAPPPVIVSIHSYTPVWRGTPRPWHAGILWDRDPRAVLPVLEGLRADPALVVGDNEPYDGALKNDTMYRHGTLRGLAHVLIEVRQDLIADEAGVGAWADRLEPILARLPLMPDLREVRHFGSRACS
ncbi:N-formylglutamate amidohydrolase [Pannonibacter tanglangensis]|uniref:N-formylglutamate amidohydrolase n=1 Tax=Pannonibacter tanglangensis TaxID=2750084 RepID=A0ABW9ZMJ8_9HYPH|nr:N-formylglutamate amidohydrolase [Pannonibacter sp. XCT-34]NBN65293.1 N-formylglutamate amidohydrolase [Pannonibacter sp. XCT-34]